MSGEFDYLERLPIEPNETIFSWVSRYHYRYGNGSFKMTTESLLGSHRIRIHPYLPSNISYINTHLDVETLVRHHTLYSLFAYFGSEQDSKLLNSMCYGPTGVVESHRAKASMGTQAGHYFCSLCVEECRTDTGLSPYVIHDQFPGIDCCPIHGIQLQIIDSSDEGIDRKLMLPVCRSDLVEKSAYKNRLLAFKARELVSVALVAGERSHQQHQKYYLSVLKQLGYVLDSGQLKMESLKTELARFYQDYQPPMGMEAVTEFYFLGPMLRNKTSFNQNPFHHLLLSTWIDYTVSIDDSRFKLIADEVAPKRNIDDEVLTLLKAGQSIRDITLKLDCAYSVVRRVAALNGIKLNEAPRWRHHLIVMASLGRHRSYIAQKLGLPIHLVESEISGVKGLVKWRLELDKMRRWQRSVFMIKHAVTTHTDWSRQNVKTAYNKEFFYLYKYDRKRLEELLPPKIPARRRSYK